MLIPYIVSLTILFQFIHTYPICQCREAFEGGDDQGEETIPFCATQRLDGMFFFPPFQHRYLAFEFLSADAS